MYTEFDPYENLTDEELAEILYKDYTIKDQARDLQISVEECEAFNKSHLTWLEWINTENHRFQWEYLYDEWQ